ncbi:MAG: hypothetical protein AB8F34_15675 [Akkermansiaceae bacterium]
MKVYDLSIPSSIAAKSKRGFALIATISVMTLLVMLALAMLSFSMIEVRSSRLGDAEQEAKANARLSLLLAIGQLQKAAGPDQRITTPGQLFDPNVSPAITGVWESHPLNPNSYPDIAAAKQRIQTDSINNGEHIQWLTSSSIEVPTTVSPPESIRGIGRARLLSLDTEQKSLSADLVTFPRNGGGAWASIDEGVKTRFNLARDNPEHDELVLARLRSPERSETETIDALSGLVYTTEEAYRLNTVGQSQIKSADKTLLAMRFHDITTWSAGLHTNVVNGGLKKDLSLAFETSTLPTDLAQRRVYSNKDIPLLPADPYFSTLSDYYNLYKSQSKPGQTLHSSTPQNYNPSAKDSTGLTIPNPQALQGQLLTPVVTRVNIVFSLIARTAHDHWINTVPNKTGDPNRKYMVYLIYSPVVTLYNPYTQPISVTNLKTTFRYLPLAFRFYRSNKSQNLTPVLLSQMHIASQNRSDWEDSFSCTLNNSIGSGSSGELIISPGESRVFGVSHEPGTTWRQMGNFLYQNNLDNSKTIDAKIGAGFNFSSGFIVDWLAPAGPGRDIDNSNLGVFGVRADDTIDVGFEPRAPSRNGNAMKSFGVQISANVEGNDTQIASYRYTYGSVNRLVEAMEGGLHPTLGRISYPVRREKPWNLNELFQPNMETTPIEEWTAPKQFAIFTLANRTSKDSLYPTQAGGQSSFVQTSLDMDITNTHPAHMPMELSFLPIKGQGAGTVGSIDVFSANDPRSFSHSGWSAQNGLLHHPTYQIPRAPLTNIAELRHANLASSGHLPVPTYTVGESSAHPLLPANKLIDATSQMGYQTADHSWLANNTLWDHYYFSGLRNSSDIENFLSKSELPLKPRQVAHLPYGMNSAAAKQTLESSEGWLSAAAYQLQKGSFNVNSTSVEAWKSLLSSLTKKAIPMLSPTQLQPSSETSQNAAFPRIYDAPSGSLADLGAASSQERWTGFRDLDDTEVQKLAESIVEEIKENGPFLSLSEFINRNPRGNEKTTAREGLIERAIRKSGINLAATSNNSRAVTETHARDFEYPYQEAAIGDSEEAASAFLSQGDVLSVIGSTLSARSDTFRIRAHGESRDKTGKVIATATCEAILQRIPDYIDTRDRPDANIPINSLRRVNQVFGRRFKIVHFRWIRPEDI